MIQRFCIVTSISVVAMLAACAAIVGIEDLPEACSDGVLQPEEACDDGNTVSGDGCNATCTSDETCGNGFRDPNEACDDAGNSPDCNANCSVPVCGDGFVNPAAGEECEDGNTMNGDGCFACQSECGNGVQDRGEQCDPGDADGDGDADETQTCNRDCTLSECGDGYQNLLAEECDDGAANSDELPLACRSGCRLPGCGDGVIDNGTRDDGQSFSEQCDDGEANSDDSPLACRSGCRLPVCGDGVVDNGTRVGGQAFSEECDTGSLVDTGSCDGDCTDAICGDGYANEAAGEACDGGNGSNPVDTASCDRDCTARICGDGYVNGAAGEACDDGNTNNTDACPACQAAFCGDGFVHAGVEACDLGASPAGCADGLVCTSSCSCV